MQETQVWSPVREDALVKEMATLPSILAWEIPRTEEPGQLLTWGGKESDVAEHAHTLIFKFKVEVQMIDLRAFFFKHRSLYYNFLFVSCLGRISETLVWCIFSICSAQNPNFPFCFSGDVVHLVP